MVKKLVMLGILLFLISMVFALEVANTQLTINTKPNHELSVKVTDAATGKSIDSFTKNSGDGGSAVFGVSSIGAKELNVEVSLAKDFVEITTESFGPFPVNTPITIDIGLTEKTKEPEVVEEVVEDTPETGITGTGKTITGEGEGKVKKIFSKTVLLIAGLVIIIGFIGFFGVKFLMSGRGIASHMGGLPSHIIVRKQSEILKERQSEREKDKELVEAEKKLQEAQLEINKLKNKAKIEEVERRIEADKELLRRLRSGEA